jgi:hypothetical protein
VKYVSTCEGEGEGEKGGVASGVPRRHCEFIDSILQRLRSCTNAPVTSNHHCHTLNTIHKDRDAHVRKEKREEKEGEGEKCNRSCFRSATKAL